MTGTLKCSIPPAVSPATTDLRPELLRVRSVEMDRNGKQVLENITFSVRRGDFFAVTGPNGGGKTTLMRIILGLLKPTRGSVEYLQRGVRIGYLPQKSRVDSRFPISVREAVASGLLGVKGLSRSEIAGRVDEMLRMVELTSHSSKSFGALSGGQQQRVLLARAIVSAPELLVLDEPLSYLDKHFVHRIYEIIKEISARTTILLVSHEITAIAEMANRHIIIDRTLTECQSAKHFARMSWA